MWFDFNFSSKWHFIVIFIFHLLQLTVSWAISNVFVPKEQGSLIVCKQSQFFGRQ